jgi:hypothetical protein
MTVVYLACRRCGGERSDVDLGSAACVQCRRNAGEVSSAEIAAALARIDRTQGGSAPRVSWQTEKAPQWLWSSTPPSKDSPRRVLVIPVDGDPDAAG